jgi:hypothetical protein
MRPWQDAIEEYLLTEFPQLSLTHAEAVAV